MTWRSYSQDGDARAIITRRFARAPKCGNATADGQTIASDGLLTLRAAVGAGSCALCICDADRSGQIRATDAFLILEVAIGKPIALEVQPVQGAFYGARLIDLHERDRERGTRSKF